jgi:lipopolysaccharide assembly protein B
MEFDFSWILLGLPLAFALGWVASRFDMRQLRLENRQAPKAYFKGLNFLLNEQQDQAIDAFIEAVQSDPDTSELHFALGNLFRRRGEFERAVRVHEHLLSRDDLVATDRHRAQHALALDYLKAGLLDRAEAALHKLEGTAFEAEAGLALLAIFERSRDWHQAAAIAEKLEAAGHGNFSVRRAHYLCEEAAQHAAPQDRNGGKDGKPAQATNGKQGSHAPLTAKALLTQALALNADTARPGLALALWHEAAGDPTTAFQTLVSTAERVPMALPLMAKHVAHTAQASGQQAAAVALLRRHYDQRPSLDVMQALVTLDESVTAARDWYVRHLEREPSLVAAAQWIAGEKLEHEQFHPQVQRALDHAVKPLTRYRCAACGFEAKQHFWQCPGCQSWDSYPARRVEEL